MKHVRFEESDSSEDEVDVALKYLVKAMQKKKSKKHGKHTPRRSMFLGAMSVMRRDT